MIMMKNDDDLFNEILESHNIEMEIGKVYVICDTNENTIKKNQKVDSIPELLRNIENCIVVIHPLDFGDYLISHRMGVELKRRTDFANSTIYADPDHNLWKQMRGLSEMVFYPNIIIQDFGKSKWMARNRMPQLMGSVESFAYKYPMHYTNSDEETARLIYNMAKREQRKKKHGFSRSVNRKMSIDEKQEYLIQGLIDTGEITAKMLLDVFKNPVNVFDAIELAILHYKDENNKKHTSTQNLTQKGLRAYKFEWHMYDDFDFDKIKGIGLKWILRNKEMIGGDLNV